MPIVTAKLVHVVQLIQHDDIPEDYAMFAYMDHKKAEEKCDRLSDRYAAEITLGKAEVVVFSVRIMDAEK